MATAKGLGDLLDRYVGVGEHLPRRAHLLRRPAAIVDHPNGNWVSPSSYSVGEEVRFALDSLLEGDGFELPVPGALGEAERARRGKITDPLFSFVSLAYGYPATSCVGINPKNLNRPPKR